MKTAKNLELQDDQTFILHLTLNQAQIRHSLDQILKKIALDFHHPGFRPGKVPPEIIQQNIDQEKLYQEVIEDGLTPLYQTAIKEHQLRPIIAPQIVVKNPPLSFDKDWQIELTACQMPPIKLNPDYLNEIKRANLKAPNASDSTAQIYQIILRNSQVTLPSILLDKELNHRISHLIDQTEQAGISVKNYLSGRKLTIEELQKQYLQDIQRDWTLQLAIDKIAAEHLIKVTPQDLKDFSKDKSPHNNLDPSTVQNLICQQKTISFLSSQK